MTNAGKHSALIRPLPPSGYLCVRTTTEKLNVSKTGLGLEKRKHQMNSLTTHRVQSWVRVTTPVDNEVCGYLRRLRRTGGYLISLTLSKGQPWSPIPPLDGLSWLRRTDSSTSRSHLVCDTLSVGILILP